jgi:hypothetical protein
LTADKNGKINNYGRSPLIVWPSVARSNPPTVDDPLIAERYWNIEYRGHPYLA